MSNPPCPPTWLTAGSKVPGNARNALNRSNVFKGCAIRTRRLRANRHTQATGTTSRKEGCQEGRQEGRKREARLVLRLLQRRLGAVSTAQQARIAALPIDAVEDLGEALLDFADMADLSAWLATH